MPNPPSVGPSSARAVNTHSLSNKFACYLAFSAFVLTFLIGLGAEVPPLSLVGRALTGAMIFWFCGLALGSVVATGLVETTDEDRAGSPEGSGRDPASSTPDGPNAQTAAPGTQQDEALAADRQE